MSSKTWNIVHKSFGLHWFFIYFFFSFDSQIPIWFYCKEENRTHVRTSAFVFYRRKNVIQVWFDMKVNDDNFLFLGKLTQITIGISNTEVVG